MNNTFTDATIIEILMNRAQITDEFQRCSFIIPDGRYFEIEEHYELYKYLVIEQLVQCIPDAEYLLDSLGFIRYSWIGYMTLSSKAPTSKQYKAIEDALIHISQYRDEICIQLQDNPREFQMYSLDDIPYIVDRIKHYYQTATLLV